MKNTPLRLFLYIVYLLCHPISGIPFYVGAGTRYRPAEHMRDHLLGKHTNVAKDLILAQIAALGLQPKVVSLYWFATMDEAYAREVDVIAAMRGAGYRLTNVLNGGKWTADKHAGNGIRRLKLVSSGGAGKRKR